MAIHTENTPLRGLSLCTGLAGLELGLHIAEPQYRTICYVERNAYCSATLVERMAEKRLDDAPIWSDVTSFDGKPWRGKVDIITGGYPCQPFSVCGKRAGEEDPRHLWPSIRRIIEEIEPRYCFFENVQGHIDRGFSTVARDLENLGFSVQAGLFTAAEVGASHRRARLFILANANSQHKRQQTDYLCNKRQAQMELAAKLSSQSGRGEPSPQLYDGFDYSIGLDGNGQRLYPPLACELEAWRQELKKRPQDEPAILGMDDGMAHRVERHRAERLHAAGNGVVPMQAALAYHTLKQQFD